MLKKIFLISSLCILASCNTSSLFNPIESHLSGPIAVAVDTSRNRAYVVNSNMNYAYTNATLSILDITSPTAPALISQGPVSIPNFASSIYLDTTTGQAFIPNRLSDSNADTVDNLLRINVDESSGTFGTVESFAAGDNPFGTACCDTAGRFYNVNIGGTLSIYTFSDLENPISISLAGTLQSGLSYSGANSVEALILGSQVFVTNRGGRIYVINTDEVADTSKNPIDHLITNVGDARGIATDGTLLYVIDGSVRPGIVRVINPSTLTPATPDSATRPESDILGTPSIQTTTVTVGNNPNKIFITGGKAYVTNQDDDTVSVIDLTSNTVTQTISVGDQPFGLTAFTSGANNYLYVTNLFSNSISIIDLSSNTVVATFAP